MSEQSLIAVVPAAGVGRRMASGTPKQYLHLVGATVIEHALRAIDACDFIGRIVVGIHPKDRYWPTLPIVAQSHISAVVGGTERVHTVLQCLLALHDSDDDHWVLVHDAARPCITPAMISALWSAVKHDPWGGLLAVPIHDTVKRQDHQRRAVQTLDRTALWCAQTPQIFRLGKLREALLKSQQSGCAVTDEASAIELIGGKPLLVSGSVTNIKITRHQDLSMAAVYLNYLNRGQGPCV